MRDFHYTLLADGSSDRALLPILTWLLRQYPALGVVQSNFADPGVLPRAPTTLSERTQTAIELFPCRALFIHRDAEAQPFDLRVRQIHEAVATAFRDHPGSRRPHVCVVPVRMQEAWLLFDETALRRAAGNPNGTESLDLPRLAGLERLPDPKAVLWESVRRANGLSARRQHKMNLGNCTRLVSEHAADFAPLRALSAFAALECEVARLAAGVSRTRQA